MKKWTNSQLKAIETTDSDIIVSASAGSGKTSAMVERALRLMTEKRVPIERIMLLTYTNNAAGEMKERLRQGLIAYAKENPSEASFVREQLDSMSQANISTIHGFCFKIVQEFFEVVGLSPSVGIQSDGDVDDDIARACDNTIKRCEADEEIVEIMDKISLRRNDTFIEIILSFYDYMTAQPDREEWLDHCMELYDEATSFEKGQISNYVSRFYANFAKIYSDRLRNLISIASDLGDEIAKKYALGTLDRIQIFEHVRNVKELYDRFCIKFSKNRKPNGDGDPILMAQIGSLWSEFKKKFLDKLKVIFSCGKDYAEMVQNRYEAGKQVSAIIKAVKIYQEEYDRVKNLDNKIDFADMERYTVQILSDETIAEEIRDRHDYVFVDEFQDTNYVQFTIIEKVTPKDRLFVVGDVKQSIYRFRLAEPQIFLKLLEKLGGEGKAISFNDNFRSDNRILEFVNHVFDLLMTPEFGSIDYMNNERFTIRENAFNSEIPPVKILYPILETVEVEEKVLPIDENGVFDITKDNIPEYTNYGNNEAGLIYNYIQSVLGKKIYVKGEERIVKYSDIVIMYIKRGAASSTLSALSSFGIPLNMGDFEKDVAKKDLDIFMDYISIIDNLYDDYPLISALHSFIGGLSNKELAEIKTKCPTGRSFYLSCKEYMEHYEGALRDKLVIFFGNVERYRFLATYTEVSELLAMILEESGYRTYLQSKEDGERILSAIDFYIASIRGKKYVFDLYTFVKHYKKSKSIELKAITSDSDGVRVCTMHSSKGLEFPIVIIAGVYSNAGGFIESVRTDRNLGVGMKYYNPTTHTMVSTLDMEVIKLKKFKDDAEDRLRLLYVALTRAQCGLAIILNKRTDPCVNPFATDKLSVWIEYCIHNDPYIKGFLSAEKPYSIEIAEKVVSTEPPVECDVAPEVADILNYRYPYKESIETARKYSVSSINSDSTNIGLMGFDDDEKSFGGTASHAVMQYIDLHSHTSEDVEKEIRRMIDEELITQEQADSVDIDEIVRCLNSEIIEKARHSEVYREHKFILSKKADEVLSNGCDENVLIQGIIDMIIDGDELIVVDFKRSRSSDEHLIERYSVQLKLYADAVERTYGRYPDKMLLYVFGRDRIVEIKR